MNGVRFYLEFPTATAKKRSGKAHARHSGNVFAAFVANGINWHSQDHGGACYDGIGSVFEYPNSPVASTSASLDRFLRPVCKRIPERLAREIHPRLFQSIDVEVS